MDIEHIKTTYRSPDPNDYPELTAYTPDEIYEDYLGPGGLYLAAKMTRGMNLKPGDIVLDLGCGKGASSIFLVNLFDVQVIAVDLWNPVDYLNEKFSARGYRDRIVPLNMDITGPLPFAEGYFDAIFCMNSLSFYGGNVAFLNHLLKHLKPGGAFGVGSEILNEEFSPEAFANPPAVYDFVLPGTDIHVWEGDFSKQHSPPWWEQLFTESGLLEVLDCRELDDAIVLLEDQVKYNIAHNIDPFDAKISVEQLEFGRQNRPYRTLFTITARKK